MTTIHFIPKELRSMSGAQEHMLKTAVREGVEVVVKPREKRTAAKLHKLGYAVYDTERQIVKSTAAGIALVAEAKQLQKSAHNFMSMFAGKNL